MSSAEIVSKPAVGDRRLKVQFFQQGDRHAHRLLLVDGEHETPLLDSVEGDDRADWPPSPPLQQLTVEDRPDGAGVLLLVGMAGTSHWSLSVEPHPTEPALLFDVACRIKGECGSLGSQYRCQARPEKPRDSQAVEFQVDGQRIRFESVGAAGERPTSVVSAGDTLSIQPSPPAESPPTTARWKYRVSLVS